MGAIVVGGILGGAIMCAAGLIRVHRTEGGRKMLIVTVLTILGAAIGAGLAGQFAALSAG